MFTYVCGSGVEKNVSNELEKVDSRARNKMEKFSS